MPNIAIAMGLKEEAEVIRQNIEYHLALGIYKIFIVELGSQDNSAEILREYKDHPQVDVRFFNGDLAAISIIRYNVQRIYLEKDIDYIVHLDPDEFLILKRGTTLQDLFIDTPSLCYYFRKYNVVPIQRLQQTLTLDLLRNLHRLYFFTAENDNQICYPSPSSKEDYQRWIQTVPTHKAMHHKSPFTVEIAGHHVHSPTLKSISVPGNICIAHLTVTTHSRFEQRLKSITEFVSKIDSTDRTSFFSWRIQSYAYTSNQSQQVFESLFPSKEDFLSLKRNSVIRSVKDVLNDDSFLTPVIPLHPARSYTLNNLLARGIDEVFGGTL